MSEDVSSNGQIKAEMMIRWLHVAPILRIFRKLLKGKKMSVTMSQTKLIYQFYYAASSPAWLFELGNQCEMRK